MLCANCSVPNTEPEEMPPVGVPAMFTKQAGNMVYPLCGACAQAADVAVPDPPARPIPARWLGGPVL